MLDRPDRIDPEPEDSEGLKGVSSLGAYTDSKRVLRLGFRRSITIVIVVDNEY